MQSRFQRLSGYGALLIALALVGGLYTAFLAPQGRAEDNPSTQQSANIAKGRELYLQGCSTCHGLGLQGGAGGPSLIGVGESAVIFQVESGRMPLKYGTVEAPRKKTKYTLDQIDQLAAFIGSHGGGPTMPKTGLDDGDLQQGGELFRTNCASCHNFAGKGGALSYGQYAPDLSDASARVIWGAMQSGPENMPRFSDNQLTPQEKKSITRYVEFITKSPQPGGAALGRYGPVPEGLVMWLVGITALVGVTLWIGARA
ncbi:MAG: ubiquinol-cytochrome c reductase cytochrome c subunit [Actinomycetota bacterium]|nr:ubiquinol-cytochrome c reductase cytochrome c subunit [Actinomycetota bacterium]